MTAVQRLRKWQDGNERLVGFQRTGDGLWYVTVKTANPSFDQVTQPQTELEDAAGEAVELLETIGEEVPTA